MKVLFLTRYGRLGASSRLRSMQFFPWFAAAGIECVVQSLFDDAVLSARYDAGTYRLGQAAAVYARRLRQLLRRGDFDLVWIEKEALPWLPAWAELAMLKGTPFVLDYDDAIFHNYDLHARALVRRLLGRRIDRLMAGAAIVTCGNDYLAQRARNAGARNVEIVPTVIDLGRYTGASRAPAGVHAPRIVWIGSPSTVRYLASLAGPLAELAQRHSFTLRIIGGTLEMPGVDVESVRWTEDTEVQAIADCDIGIMPLDDSPWERGKCGYKLIQYMACGLPVVASPVGVNVQIVRPGVNGLLAGDAAAWFASLEELLGDRELRENMGRAGLDLVRRQYCVQAIAPPLANLLRKAGENKTICVD